MKGLIKGSIKYISQIFVHKEHEMQIGYPTDVKHVSHIGSDSPFGSAPSWMNEFTAPSDISSGSLSNFNSRATSWASIDFDQQQVKDQQPPPQTKLKEQPCPDIPKAPKKTKKKDRSAGRLSSARSSSVSRSSYITAIQDTRN